MAWWSPTVPNLPSSSCVSPQGYRGGKEHPCQSPRAPGGALPPAPALRHSLTVCATGAGAGTALCRVLETLGLCFKFQGHELFPGKNGQIKQKANNTHEGGGFDWGFAVDFNRAPRSWARSPALQGPWQEVPMGDQGQDAVGIQRAGSCASDPSACVWEEPVPGVTQQPLSWCCEPLGVTPNSDHPLPSLGRFSLLPAAILICLSPTAG